MRHVRRDQTKLDTTISSRFCDSAPKSVFYGDQWHDPLPCPRPVQYYLFIVFAQVGSIVNNVISTDHYLA